MRPLTPPVSSGAFSATTLVISTSARLASAIQWLSSLRKAAASTAAASPPAMAASGKATKSGVWKCATICAARKPPIAAKTTVAKLSTPTDRTA